MQSDQVFPEHPCKQEAQQLLNDTHHDALFHIDNLISAFSHLPGFEQFRTVLAMAIDKEVSVPCLLYLLDTCHANPSIYSDYSQEMGNNDGFFCFAGNAIVWALQGTPKFGTATFLIRKFAHLPLINELAYMFESNSIVRTHGTLLQYCLEQAKQDHHQHQIIQVLLDCGAHVPDSCTHIPVIRSHFMCQHMGRAMLAQCNTAYHNVQIQTIQ